MGRCDDKPFRGAPRSKTALRVRLFGETGQLAEGVESVTRDVSHTGAFLRCDATFPPGTRLRLELESPDDEDGATVEVEAVVKWCSPPESEECGLGVQFVSPPTSVRRRLDRIQSEGELAVFELYDED